MTRADRREQKIRQSARNVSSEDFEWLINRYGEIISGKSHPKAHIGGHIFPYKKENPVKFHYIEAVLKFIDDIKGKTK